VQCKFDSNLRRAALAKFSTATWPSRGSPSLVSLNHNTPPRARDQAAVRRAQAGWMSSDNDGALVAALPAVSDDEAFDKMRDTVEQQVAELGDKVAALAKRYESDCKAGKAGGLITSLDLAQKQAPSRRQPSAEDGLVIFCEFEGVACSIDTEAALVGEAGGTAEERLKRLQVCMAHTHTQHAL
jgi:hypothetical protein